MKADDIKVNQLLEVEVEFNKGTEFLPSRIEEIKDNNWYISMPMRRGVYITLRVGQRIKIQLKYKNSLMGGFVTIIDRRRGHIPLLIVSKPQELIRMNQKRTFVRLEIAIPVAFKIIIDKQKSEAFEGITGDISAGGLLLYTPVVIEKDQKVEMEIKLPEHEAVFCKAHVVRVLAKAKQEGQNSKYAIEYDNFNEIQQDRIFKFIFDKQREWIKKGVRE
ncbi:MAG: flagellar brake protein [Syntrophomonadaceae bacterium]|nr:flagellar brake protein [Syntrophomonadaceae bacterium]MDD3022755.1 flagellar brake protein [Syntrophomonadaceae bacterium]